MSNLIYSHASPQEEDGKLFFYGEIGGKYCYGSAVERSASDGWTLEAQHDPVTGAPITQGPLYADLFAFGNLDGYAPASVREPYWQGHSVRLYQDPETATGNPQFPPDDQADSVEIRRKYFSGTADDGWGFRAELLYGSDPTNKAIARYLDEDYTSYHYTTGAFTLQDSEWQTDEAGDPAQVYATETPAGFRTGETQEAEYIGLWYGQLVAKSPLPVGVDRREAYYFTHDIGASAGAWIDSGARTNGDAGSLNYFTAPTVPFVTGQSIQIDGNPHTITSLWPSEADPQGFIIDPFVAYAPGLVIEVQE